MQAMNRAPGDPRWDDLFLFLTLFREGSQPPLYRSAEDAWAIFADQYGPCPVKIGISYNTINDG